MARFLRNLQPVWRAILCAGVAAGVLSTLAQLLLWALFTGELPAILYRDARLTAALVLGGSVLPPPASFDAGVMAAATLIHFALSVCYAALLAPVAARLGGALSWLAGAGFGAALYAVNLYGFTVLFPWFAQARGGAALAAHVVFGVTAVWVLRRPCFRNAQSRPGGH
jgi:hypothetical protein